MDVIQKLKIETDGFCSTVQEYCHDGTVLNHFVQLKNALENNDIESISYCLTQIQDWYSATLFRIEKNYFVTNFETHKRNYNLICQYAQIIQQEECELKKKYAISNEQNELENKSPLVFLSHKSDDKKYANALRDFIVGLGVKDNQLIYTSHPMHKIPLDADIFDYLRESFGRKIFVIILWSDKYLESPACLNEMGAAWVTQSDYTNIYVPTFSFGNPKYHECAVDTRKMGAVLNGDSNCRISMIELKNKIQNFFNLENDETKSSFLLDQFIKSITAEE